MGMGKFYPLAAQKPFHRLKQKFARLITSARRPNHMNFSVPTLGVSPPRWGEIYAFRVTFLLLFLFSSSRPQVERNEGRIRIAAQKMRIGVRKCPQIGTKSVEGHLPPQNSQKPKISYLRNVKF